ncbi:MAG: 4Fe-4S ferredoxin [Gammaproteobacteria bacterium]|nr:4Fe-4S ferredoxin [Gammaproteobacteria bacterium]
MTDRNSEITGRVLREPSGGTDTRKMPEGGRSKATCKQEPGTVVPVVDLKRCEGKGDCVRVCPENVFEIRRIEKVDYRRLGLLHRFKQRVHGMQVAYTPNGDACRACGLCVAACPERAITLSRGME